MEKYAVIDLFAGAGGLSLGFMQTGKYEIKVAFENNPDMQATYKKNHPNVEVMGNVCDADYALIKKKYGDIDIVIGGPPCQGFSNANRQKNTAISQNNMLVRQYIRAILELNPKAFVMENVSMLKSEVHRFYLTEDDVATVNAYKIPVKETSLCLLESSFSFDGVLDIIRSYEQVVKYLWDEKHYAELNVVYKAAKNAQKLPDVLKKHKKNLLEFSKTHINDSDDVILKADSEAFRAIVAYFSNECESATIQDSIAKSIMYQRMLSKAKEIFDNNIVVERYETGSDINAIIKSYAVYDYLKSILESEKHGYTISSNVLCAADYGAPQKRMRFVAMGIKKSISSKVALPKGSLDEDEYYTVRDAIEDIEDVKAITDVSADIGINLQPKEVSKLAEKLRDSTMLYNHIITKTTDVAMERFKALKQGQNFHALSDNLKTNTYTDASRTQNTIYLRLNYDEPSGTVVNVRKSMWIHPTLDRAISVREAARLQTFPDSFIFCGSKDKQYQQVGNAVPPIMAKAIAKKLAKLLATKGS